MGDRTEKDFLGEKQIPDDAYYGVQTVRGKENFHITGMPMSREPYFVKAFGYVKKAAAMANRDLGVLDAKIADAIIRACDRVIAGDMNDQFVTDFIQGGAGTSTTMNANEVVANLALESLGHKRGEYQSVNPNDHLTDHFGLVSDFLSECWSRMRETSRLSAVKNRVFWGGALSGRDIEAANKTVSGLIKLLFPDPDMPASAAVLKLVTLSP